MALFVDTEMVAERRVLVLLVAVRRASPNLYLDMAVFVLSVCLDRVRCKNFGQREHEQERKDSQLYFRTKEN